MNKSVPSLRVIFGELFYSLFVFHNWSQNFGHLEQGLPDIEAFKLIAVVCHSSLFSYDSLKLDNLICDSVESLEMILLDG